MATLVLICTIVFYLEVSSPLNAGIHLLSTTHQRTLILHQLNKMLPFLIIAHRQVSCVEDEMCSELHNQMVYKP